MAGVFEAEPLNICENDLAKGAESGASRRALFDQSTPLCLFVRCCGEAD